MNLWMAFIKNLIKSSLDQYTLPGTLTGTQILWLYLIEWKRHVADIGAGSLAAFFAHLSIPTMARAKTEVPDDPTDTEGRS